MKKRIGSLLLILALCFTLLPTAAFAEGTSVDNWDGTADTSWYTSAPDASEYHISTAEQLTGSVSLNSTAWRIDNSMNVGTSGITSTSPGTLTYEWYRVDHEGNEFLIADESGNTYTPKVAADVGKKIKVVVTAENYSGSLEATSPYTVSKKPYDGATPTAPTGINPTSNFVVFTKTENYYYAVTSAAITTAPSSGWTNQDGFSGLTPNTSYKLWYRVGETDIMESSPENSVQFKTLKAPISSVTFTLADPVKGTTLPTLSDLGSGYIGAVEWYKGEDAIGTAVTGLAEGNQVYTAKVTLTADPSAGESFANSVTVPTGYTKDSNDGAKLVLTKTFPKTAEKSLTGLEITGNTIGTKHHGDKIEKSELTVKATYDDGSTNDAFTDYTIVYNGAEANTALKKGDNSITVEVGSVKSTALAVNGVLGQVLTAADFDFKTLNEVTYNPAATAGITNLHNLTWGAVNRKGDNTAIRDFITHYGRFRVTDESGTVANTPTKAGNYTIKFWWSSDAAATHEARTEAEALTFTGKILPKDISGANIVFGTQKTYNGTEQGVALSSDSIKDGTVSLIGAGKDYSIVSGNKATDVGDNTLVIKGEGNYTGEARATWSLVAKDVTITPTSGLSKTYGAADPTLTYTTSIDSDTTLKGKFDAAKSGALSYTGTDVGAYIIGIGTLKAGNNFKLKLDTTVVFFTIKQATPVITATTPRQLVNNGVEVDISDWASFTNTDSDAKLTYTLGSARPGIALAGNKLKAASSVAAGATFEIKVNAYGTHNFTAPTEFTIHVTVVNKVDAGVSITTPPASKTYGDANFILTATKSASVPDGGTWNWTSSDDTVLKIVDGADSATATVQVLKASATGATLTVTYTSSTHYGSSSATITVAQKEVTVSGITAANKEYDGGTSATVNASGATITGKVDGDDLTVSVAAGSTFDSAGAGSRTVTLGTLTLGGTSAGNYTLATSGNQTTATANITPATLTVTPVSVQTKKYSQPDPTTLNYAYSGAAPGETPAFDGALSRVAGEDVGLYNITLGTLALKDHSGSGFRASNYTLKMVSPVVQFVITKGTYGGSAPTKTVNILKNYAGVQTGTLTAADFFTTAPAEAKITATVPASTSSNMMSLVSKDASGNFTYASKTNITAASNENWTITISSKNYTDITATLTFKLVDKADVSAQITFPNGELTYNGAGQKYEKATTSTTAIGTPAWTYTYVVADATASLDSAGLPKTAGTYTVTAKYEDDAHIGTKNATLTINKATPTGAPKYTAITTNGKTLADAGLTVTGSTLNPTAGALEWVDDAGKVLPDTTAVAANTTYKWRFTPTDANYKALTGSIELYHKSSSSGGGGGSSHSSRYTITVDSVKHGTITVSPKSAYKGDTVTITVKPDKGYELDTLKVLDKDGDKVKITEKKGKYTFTMPASKVTVKGKFVEEAPEQIFVDVPVDAYCYEAVKWAASEGITGGIGNNLFAPDRPCTRGQIVTFLWRAAGSPAPKSMSSFADVAEDAYYAKAVAWAVENGITGGTGNGKFSPDATCTRAQAVTFLYRASGSPAVSGSAAFSDVAADAYYASAVKWAEKNGITGGIGGGLFGSDNNCTRGQIVTFLYRAFNK